MSFTFILSINAGSSSVKLSLYKINPKEESPTPKLVVDSSISKLTSPPPIFSYTNHDSTSSDDIKNQEVKEISSQDDAFKYFLDHLTKDSSIEGISSGDDIRFVCHRIVHGGDFSKPVIINDHTYNYMDQLTDLAPLHNAPALGIVRTALKRLPKSTNIAYFDSSFHITMPDYIKTYPLDPKTAKEGRIRKYGFHGISYGFITRSVAEFLGKKIEETSIIALHLGSGASACAIKNGKSLDTSMGLTPLEGLPGASRSGSIDPSLVFHYTSHAGNLSQSSTSDMHISKAEDILNKHSGWTALTGTTDFGVITKKALSGTASGDDQKYKLAFDIFSDRILGFVGSYYVKLGGKVDALVFAGGIGEKSADLRKAVTSELQSLGFGLEDDGGEKEVDDRKDDVVIDISHNRRDSTGKKVLVCKTDEQFEMARDCAQEEEFWV